MQLKIKDFLIDFCKVYLLCVMILLNLIHEIRFHIILCISLTLYAKINAIVIFINVFEDVFVYLNVRVNFYININIVFDRKIKIIKHYLTILFEIIL